MKMYYKHIFALILVVIGWSVFMSMASGAEIPKQSISLIEQHSADVAKIQFWIIGGLLGIVQTLLAYIYISGIRDLKSSIKELKITNDEAHSELRDTAARAHCRIDDVVETKLSKGDHDRICKGGGKQ